MRGLVRINIKGEEIDNLDRLEECSRSFYRELRPSNLHISCPRFYSLGTTSTMTLAVLDDRIDEGRLSASSPLVPSGQQKLLLFDPRFPDCSCFPTLIECSAAQLRFVLPHVLRKGRARLRRRLISPQKWPRNSTSATGQAGSVRGVCLTCIPPRNKFNA